MSVTLRGDGQPGDAQTGRQTHHQPRSGLFARGRAHLYHGIVDGRTTAIDLIFLGVRSFFEGESA